MVETIPILVIDDSMDDRMLYQRSLSKCTGVEYRVAEADDGESGIRQLEENPPACVLLDYSMPGRDGLAILKEIRASHPFVPVVMLTGQGNETVAVNAMREGAQNYIAKATITPETLDHVIHMAITHCALEKRIEEQRASLEIFTHALAHDLREPVRTIHSYMEMITQREKFSGKTLEYFNFVTTAAQRIHALIDTVYLYTRLDNVDQVPREPCDVSLLLEEVRVTIGQLVHERQAVITADALPVVQANRTQLTQILQNLICNAIHHCKEVPHIHLSAEDGQGAWLLRISDNGPGIAVKDREKIFHPFKRLSREREEGLGLGLAICKRIIEAHGGKITYEERPGYGATFLLTLPHSAATELKKPVAVEKAPPAKAAPAVGNLPLANMMVVDDSNADIELTRFRLIERPHMQCQLHVAHNGEEALAQLHDHETTGDVIDVMLLDINMPEMDGFEVLEQMRKDHALDHVVVVMCSGSTYDKDIARAKSLGAAAYLVKPIKFETLQEALEQTDSVQLRKEGDEYVLLRTA